MSVEKTSHATLLKSHVDLTQQRHFSTVPNEGRTLLLVDIEGGLKNQQHEFSLMSCSTATSHRRHVTASNAALMEIKSVINLLLAQSAQSHRSILSVLFPLNIKEVVVMMLLKHAPHKNFGRDGEKSFYCSSIIIHCKM
ncbi:hypothetical protein CRENBAI_013761 [Crenichthys baileyi]|uniref:Uncharacterized protein n=1 Tax=Crenichthys baileyi TaxID=28760 RepID=A0AAV9QQY8_9TELE